MRPETPETISAAARAALADHPVVRFGVLFGSAAKGRLGPASDVDVGVAGARPLTLPERIDLTDTLTRAMDREVDVVDLTAAHGLILKEALVGNRPFLNRDPVLYGKLMQRFFLEEADYGPLRRRITEANARRAGHGA